MMQFQHLFSLLILVATPIVKSQSSGCGKDIVFLLDFSGSVSAETEIPILKAFLANIINRLDIGTGAGKSNVAIVKFETSAFRVVGLSSNKNEIIQKLNAASATQGWTNYIEALDIATTILQNEDRQDSVYPDVVVILTDGKPTRDKNGNGIPDNSYTAENIAKRADMHQYIIDQTTSLKNQDTRILAISVSSETDRELLGMMISNTKIFKESGDGSENNEGRPQLFLVNDFEGLSKWSAQQQNEFVNAICGPSIDVLPCTDGKIEKQCAYCIDRTCDNPALICGTVCEKKCVCPDDKPMLHNGNCITMSQCPARSDCLDVTILVDISGSVSNLQGNKVATTRSYLHRLVDAMDIGSGTGQSRVAMITFETHAQQIADFSHSKQQINQAIDTIGETQGWTNYFEAFHMANNLYPSALDRRDNAHPDFIILLTDGKPTVTKSNETLSEHDMSASGMAKRVQMHQDIIDEVNKFNTHTSTGRTTVFVRGVGNNTDMKLLGQIDTTGQSQNPLKVDGQGQTSPSIGGPESYTDFSINMDQYVQETLLMMRSKCENPIPNPSDCLDLTILMDMSGSIMNIHNENSAKIQLQNAFSRVVSRYNSQHFALVQFSDDANVVFELGTHQTSFINAQISQKVQRGGWTATAKAFQLVKDNIYRGFSPDRSSGKNIVAILTDGHPTMSLNFSRIRETADRESRRYIEDEAIEEARRLKNQDNAMIIAVLVDGTHRQNRDFLEQVVTDRNNHIRTVGSFSQVGDSLISLLSNINVQSDPCSD